MNNNTNQPQPHKKPTDGTTTTPLPQPKPLTENDNTPKALPNVPWRDEELPSQRLLNAIGKPSFIL